MVVSFDEGSPRLPLAVQKLQRLPAVAGSQKSPTAVEEVEQEEALPQQLPPTKLKLSPQLAQRVVQLPRQLCLHLWPQVWDPLEFSCSSPLALCREAPGLSC